MSAKRKLTEAVEGGSSPRACSLCFRKRGTRHAIDCRAQKHQGAYVGGSGEHKRMEVKLPNGMGASITGDPNMPPETMNALLEMMTILSKGSENGTLHLPENTKDQPPSGSAASDCSEI